MNKVLVVEDEPRIRELLHESLGGDYEIQSVSEGTAAVTQANMFQPSVILLDVRLLGAMDGMEILKLLKSNELTSTIPVIVYTNIGEDRSQEFKEAGAAEYINKATVGINEVTNLIQQYANKPPEPVVNEGETKNPVK